MLQISATELLRATARFHADGTPLDVTDRHLGEIRNLREMKRRKQIGRLQRQVLMWVRAGATFRVLVSRPIK
jgi:hypothetical protein